MLVFFSLPVPFSLSSSATISSPPFWESCPWATSSSNCVIVSRRHASTSPTSRRWRNSRRDMPSSRRASRPRRPVRPAPASHTSRRAAPVKVVSSRTSSCSSIMLLFHLLPTKIAPLGDLFSYRRPLTSECFCDILMRS